MMERKNTVTVKSFELGLSSLLDARSKTLVVEQTDFWNRMGEECNYQVTENSAASVLRDIYRRNLLPMVEKQKKTYDVKIERKEIAGIEVEIFTPVICKARVNRHQILISLHGGGFVTGDLEGGQVESIPIAATSGIPVVSINYRLAPDAKFPAASDDVIAVYCALLQEYSSMSIGVYGASAGALLSAQVLAQLIKREIPLPAAVGMFALGAFDYMDTDSMSIVKELECINLPATENHPYYGGDTCLEDVFPGCSDAIIRRFPPSLLISSIRDLGLSSVVQTHNRLIENGVPAELRVWEGLRHCFFYDPDFDQSKEMYAAVGRHFNRYLSS